MNTTILKTWSELPPIIRLYGFDFRLKFKRQNGNLFIGYFLDGVNSKSRQKKKMYLENFWYDKRAANIFPTKIYTSWLMADLIFEESDKELLQALQGFKKHICDLLRVENDEIHTDKPLLVTAPN